jgi:hypothetical protein
VLYSLNAELPYGLLGRQRRGVWTSKYYFGAMGLIDGLLGRKPVEEVPYADLVEGRMMWCWRYMRRRGRCFMRMEP